MANVFLSENEKRSAIASDDEIFGNDGDEAAILPAGVSGVNIDGSVERLDSAANLADHTFQSNSDGELEILVNGEVIATVPSVPSDGLDLRAAEGNVTVKQGGFDNNGLATWDLANPNDDTESANVGQNPVSGGNLSIQPGSDTSESPGRGGGNGGTLTLTESSNTVTEGGSTVVTVTLNNDIDSDTTFSIQPLELTDGPNSAATAAADFSLSENAITFLGSSDVDNSGQRGQFQVNAATDDEVEPPEDAGYQLVDSQGNVVLQDSVVIQDNTSAGGAETFTLTEASNTVTGGAGADTLTGGASADVFTYTGTNATGLAAETGLTTSTADVIADFATGEDTIDLAVAGTSANFFALDATSGGTDDIGTVGAAVTAANNASGAGTSFDNTVQYMHVFDSNGGNNGYLVADEDTDGTADYAIELTGQAASGDLVFGDIVA